MEFKRKADSLTKNRLLIIPQTILDKLTQNHLFKTLYLTDIGFFPNADNHHREREEGCSQAILIMCVKGKGIVEINSVKYVLLPNQFILLPADTPHRYFADPSNPWSIHWLHFNGDQRDSFSALLSDKQPVTTLTNKMVLRAVLQFEELYSILTNGYSLQLMLHLSNSLKYLLTMLCLDEGHIHGQQLTQQNYIDFCIQIMKQSISTPYSLNQIADQLALSKNYLISLFREKTGYTPMNYLIHLKMQQACEYLDTTNLSVKEVGELVGYHDSFYFSRIFKKVMKQSPNAYRKTSKG